MSISVCIATYNGEEYIKEQLQSIIKELGNDDEIIVVDDCSKDDTVKIIKSFDDTRIKVCINDRNMGVNFSFDKAICQASNEIIFLSDQDDIWTTARVSLMINKFRETRALVVSSNSKFIDRDGHKIPFAIKGVEEKNSSKNLRNILDIFAGKTNYYGCTMAFHKNLIPLILPFPAFIESHDLWIAMAGNLICSNAHLQQTTLLRRIHGTNASIVSRRLSKKIWSRIVFLLSIIVLVFRVTKSPIIYQNTYAK